MEQFELDDLYIKLIMKRKDCLQALYSECQKRISRFLAKEKNYKNRLLQDYLKAVQRRAEKIKEKRERERKKKEEEERRRRSMVVHIDDMSFCFGKEELMQIGGKEKEIDPEVKNVLYKMNELFKQLNHKPAPK